MDLFEKATRRKFRFETPKGLITVEELWDLPLTAPVGRASLDVLAVALDTKVNEGPRKSFVNTEAGVDPDTRAKFDIVLHVISVRKAERDAAASARAEAQEIQDLMALIAEKEGEEKRNLPIGELRNLLAKRQEAAKAAASEATA